MPLQTLDSPSKAPTPRRRASTPSRPRSRGWWGAGPPPTDVWPGVTIDIPAVWNPKAGLREYDPVNDPGIYVYDPKGRTGVWDSVCGAYYYDVLEATRACEFFPTYLSHSIGEFAGKPFDLLAYQAQLLTKPLFGWKHKLTGFRRFRKLFAFLPKGAGKSPWASGTGLYLMLCDREPGAEVYALAGDKNQARVVHTNAKTMVEDSTELNEMCEVLRDSITCPDTRSVYLVLSADAKTKHGFRPHGAIFDEFHAQPNRDLYEAIKKSMVKRRQPMLLLITHAGNDDESVCYEEYEYAKHLLSGQIVDETCLPVIFEIKDGDDWTSTEILPRINPGHGVTVQPSAIEAELREAINEPRKKNDYVRFHLNKWTNQATAWIPIDWWDACKDPIAPDDELRKLVCAAGLDLAQKFDLACFNVVFKHPIDAVNVEVVTTETPDGAPVKMIVELNYRVTSIPFFWIPEDTMREREERDHVPYSEWVRMGLVTATEGGVIDYTRIFNDIKTKILPRFPLLKQGMIGYDPAFATDLATSLRDRGGLQVAEVLQNYSHLSEPSQIAEALIKAKRVAHGGHRVYRNHWQNVAVKTDDAGRIRPVKPKSSSVKRVDGAVSFVMGLKALAMTAAKSGRYQILTFGGKK